jgi:hypothetical protein
VTAWTVWVPEADRRAAELLARAGHALDGRPAVMGAALDEIDAPAAGDLDLERGEAQDIVGVLNDAAYGYEDSSSARWRAPATRPSTPTSRAGRASRRAAS